LLADFSDLLFGFWGTGGIVLLPLFLLIAWFVMRATGDGVGRPLALQLILFGILYPCAAGLDPERQSLYLNLCAVVFLALAASGLLKCLTASELLKETPARRSEIVAGGLAQP
jgi:hypothetical protein